jgi:endonuclease/exonuclease/phosphatase family metal-dependent hydrolase
MIIPSRHTPLRRTLPVLRGALFIAALLVFMTGCGPKDPAQPLFHGRETPTAVYRSDTIAIGFYNVENLFDLQYDGKEYPEYRPGALGWNKQTQKKKLFNIASIIVAMRLDIAGLCEIESMEALKALQKELKTQGSSYPFHAMADASSGASTAPCLLSKYPLVHVNSFGGGGSSAMRNILEADCDLGGNFLKIFVNHWPSKMHPETQRIALAQALRGRIAALAQGTEYAIVGDFNSDYDQWSRTRTEKLDDSRGRTGINHVLHTINEVEGRFVSYVSKQDLCNGSCPFCHYDPWLDRPEESRFSAKYRGAPQTLDHILLPAALFDSQGLSYCENSFEAFTANGKLLRDGAPYRWQMKGFGKRRFHAGEGYSDHLPVRARLVRKGYACVPAATDLHKAKLPVMGGFEASFDGWLGCNGAIVLSRDTAAAFAGRSCLRISGPAVAKNGCAARAILERGALNAGRRQTIGFAIRGSGKLSVRIRSGTGKWRYFNGPSFTPSNSARYLQVDIPRWKVVSLPFTSDMPGSPDLEVELRAGKEAPFDFSIDEVKGGQ